MTQNLRIRELAHEELDKLTQDYVENCQKLCDIANEAMPLNRRITVSFALMMAGKPALPIRPIAEISSR